METTKLIWLIYKITKEILSLGSKGKRRLEKHFKIFCFFKKQGWIKLDKEDFDSVYFHVLYKLLEEGKDKRLLQLFVLAEVRKSCKESLYQDKPDVFTREWNHQWHTNPEMLPLKNLDINVEQEVADFISVFNKVVQKNRTLVEVKDSEERKDIKKNTEELLDLAKNTKEGTIPKYLTKLPSLADEIIGRDEEIKQLFEKLEAVQSVILVNGMGGIGKTTTAIAYVNKYKAQYQHIVWIEQLNDFKTDLTTTTLLAKNLGITLSNNQEEDTRLILNKLSNLKGKSLLVIDNGNHQLQRYHDFFPKAPDWHVLITSREELSFAEMIKLDFLSEEDALLLFYSHYKRDKDDRTLIEILKTIDFHTLTVEVLAKTAQKQRIKSLQELANLLSERGIKIGKPANFKITHSKTEKVDKLFPYLKAIFKLDADMSAHEIQLLKQFIGLPPIFILYELLLRLLQIDESDETAFDQWKVTLEKLKEKGWLTYDQQEDAYKMHRIIQDVLQDHLNPEYDDLKALIIGVAGMLYFDQAKDNPVDKFPFVPYGERLVFLFEVREEAFSDLQSNLALTYRDLGRYKKAAPLLESALQATQMKFGEEHPNVARRQSNLALAYQDLGQYKKAAALLESALQSDQTNFGEAHRSVAIRQSNLALVYKDLGQYEKAAALLESALQSDRTNFGEDHPSVARSQSNLALVYRDLGQYEKAAILLESALQSDQTNFGEDHPSVARKQSNLALVYSSLGRYEKAAALLESALQSDQTNFGEDHPKAAIRQSNLALVYKDLGRYEKAAELLEFALQSGQTNFGEDHPKVAIRQSNLALVYKDLGRYEKAVELLEFALQSDQTNFGEDNPNVAIRQSNLATVYKDLGNKEEALKLFNSAHQIFIAKFGADHPNTKIVKEHLDSFEK